MSDWAVLLTPLLVLLILALFRFTGCKPFSSAPSPPPTPTPGPPPAPKTYEDIVKATAGFAAFWPLNETGGNQAKAVSSIAGIDGIYQPAGAAAPALGRPGVLSAKVPMDFAPELDGTDDYIEVPFNPLLNTAAFSVEVWVKPNPAVTAEQVVISSHKIDAATKRGYEIALVMKPGETHHQIRGRVFVTGAPDTTGEVTAQPNQGQPDDWRHIVLTYQAGVGVTLWVRVAKFINPFKGGPLAAGYENVLATNAIPLRFGAGHVQATGPKHFFGGLIDNVAFYNAALSATDIEAHFKQL